MTPRRATRARPVDLGADARDAAAALHDGFAVVVIRGEVRRRERVLEAWKPVRT